MAYGRPPWEIRRWPSVWVYRTLSMLEQVEEPPEFGELATQGAEGEPPAAAGLGHGGPAG